MLLILPCAVVSGIGVMPPLEHGRRCSGIAQTMAAGWSTAAPGTRGAAMRAHRWE
jgi:hypothetical protein